MLSYLRYLCSHVSIIFLQLLVKAANLVLRSGWGSDTIAMTGRTSIALHLEDLWLNITLKDDDQRMGHCEAGAANQYQPICLRKFITVAAQMCTMPIIASLNMCECSSPHGLHCSSTSGRVLEVHVFFAVFTTIAWIIDRKRDSGSQSEW